MATTTGDVEATLRRLSKVGDVESPPDIFDFTGNTAGVVSPKCDSLPPPTTTTARRNDGMVTADCRDRSGLEADQPQVTVASMPKKSTDSAMSQTRTIGMECLTCSLELINSNGCDRITSLSTSSAAVGTRSDVLTSLD